MTLFSDAYTGRRVLVTGHTGFKGSWLSLWLNRLGAQVSGVSLPPETHPNHWALLQLPVRHRIVDIRDAQALAATVAEIEPEIVFHLAAQPLVRRSYRDPLLTWSTNVMGTANLLEACRGVAGVRAIVVATTDKVYENREWPWGYREIDRLSGHDPYSASKASAELVAASFRGSFFENAGPLLATARAGNVIGGGDWSEDRLIPDLARAIENGQSLEIRSPQATRPWQHVLEALAGYLLLGQKLLEGDRSFASAWNFGPDSDGNRTVADVLELMRDAWKDIAWHVSDKERPAESNLLFLDSSKARSSLGWAPLWDISRTLAETADWYRAWFDGQEVVSKKQLETYLDSARRAGLRWAASS